MAHASSGYYTSGFDNAVIFSIDGGGIDHGMVAYTKIFEGKDSEINLLDTPNINHDDNSIVS